MAGVNSVLNQSIVTPDSEYLKVSNEMKSQNELDKNAFMNLLCTQMQYQDPLNPMDNTEMLAQMAQFTSLEQMMNVANVSQKQLANTMIGEYVEYYYQDESTGVGSYYYGKVDYVDLSGDTPRLSIGDKQVDLDDIYAVINKDNIQANTTAYELIGKTVQATSVQTDAEGKTETFIIEGKVQGIQLKEGKPYVVIGSGNQQVVTEFTNVKNIVEKVSVTGRQIVAEVTTEEGKKTVKGEAEYIKIDSNNHYSVYVNGEFVDYDDIISVS